MRSDYGRDSSGREAGRSDVTVRARPGRGGPARRAVRGDARTGPARSLHLAGTGGIGPLRDQFVFFGGTALARSYLRDGRLSEDIDLIATAPGGETADALTQLVSRALRSTHGRLRWSRALREVREIDPVIVSTDDGIFVRVQLLTLTGYPQWPTRLTEVFQRYRDAPAVALRMPTRAAFAAAKTPAWVDRHAARDLYDLWALARIGALDMSAPTLLAPGIVRPRWFRRRTCSRADRRKSSGVTSLPPRRD